MRNFPKILWFTFNSHLKENSQVLSEYGKTIAELVTKYNLTPSQVAMGKDIPKDVQNIASGQTLIALRRLNVKDNGDQSKNDSGELKGLLIRYLFDARLIGHPPIVEKPIIDLSGADVTKVVLKNAWLPYINLKKAALTNGDFNKANLTKANLTEATLIGANLTEAILVGANFTGADLTRADLTGADLRFADFHETKGLDREKLKHACYVEGSQSFPAGFNPTAAGMVPIAQDKSDPNDKANFQPCSPAKTGSVYR